MWQPRKHAYEHGFGLCNGHAPMGEAVSMSERCPGVSRWREGVGVGAGHIYTQGSMQGARRFHPMLLCCQTVRPWFNGNNVHTRTHAYW